MALDPAYGGCPWPVDPACLTDDWEDFEPDVRERALALASATLERLTAYRVGNCPVKVRPCRQNPVGVVSPYLVGMGAGVGPFFPYVGRNGVWINTGLCEQPCGITDCEVTLPAPIGRLDEIKVNGVAQTLADFTVYDGNTIVYTGSGSCPFPVQQDLSKPDTQPDTFSITYLNAYPVDATGAYAVGVLAMEFARACSGSSCNLPSTVRTLSRQGVTMELITGAFPEGFTGIREVDAFISLWNPDGRKQQSRVWFPGINSPRHQTL